jgi:hypothetical protein
LRISANNGLSRRVRLAIQPQLLPDRDNGIADLFHGTLQLVFRHSKMLKPITNFCFNLHGDVAAVALALAGKNIAHQITRSRFEVNPRRVSSVMHEHGEQQNDRKRNSDEPKQDAFSERHDGLHPMSAKATYSGSVGSIAGFKCSGGAVAGPACGESPRPLVAGDFFRLRA